MNRSGYVLIAALWLMVAISAVLVDMSLWARTRAAGNIYHIESVEGAAGASAGLERSLARLTSILREAEPLIERDPSARYHVWRGLPLDSAPAGTPYHYVVSYRDAASGLNLNSATSEDLLRFFHALGYPPERARALTACVVDWRDDDEVVTPGGAERDAYTAAGRAVAPANAAFADVRELAHLLCFDHEDVVRAAPHLTVLGTGHININTATAPVLSSIRGITTEAAAALVRRRALDGVLSSVFTVVPEISAQSRDSMLAATSVLGARIVTEVMELEIRSIGLTPAGLPSATVVALAVRRNAEVTLNHRRIIR